MSTLVLVHQPHLLSYGLLFAAALESPSQTRCLDVLVTAKLRDSAEFSQALLATYSEARKQALALGFPADFAINVLFDPLQLGGLYEATYHAAGEPVPAGVGGPQCREIAQPVSKVSEARKGQSVARNSANVTAVGGTFDHMHDGHKILLLVAVFCAQSLIIVGVTGPALLTKKKYAEVLDPLPARVNAVCTFLQRIVSPQQTFQIYQINDVCGPTGYIEEIDALIISDETAKGAEFVNDYRKKHGFAPLKVISIDVIGGSSENNWEGKLSSTDLRKIDYMKRFA